MASIHKRGAHWRVLWRDPDGNQRSRSCPDAATAKDLLRDVERALALGKRWEPSGLRAPPEVRMIAAKYLEESSRLHAPKTTLRYGQILEEWCCWLGREHHIDRQGRATPSTFTRGMLAAYHAHLLAGTGRHGHPRSQSTARKHIKDVRLFWDWAWDNDEGTAWEGQVPPPRTLRLPAAPAPTAKLAPTWAQMDACIAAADGHLRQLAILLRFTGLRVGQVMRLRWDDLDLDQRILHVRPELGKSAHERGGRLIPVSGHLVAELSQWDRVEEWLVPTSRVEGERERDPRRRDMARAWARAGVPRTACTQPHHAFRHGFVSELKRAKADNEAVEHLVGHRIPGVRAIYTDPRALPLVEAVALIPPLRGVVLPMAGRGGK